MKLSLRQKSVLSESVANIGVAWFAGGVVASVFTAKTILEVIIPGTWGMILAILFISMALFILKK